MWCAFVFNHETLCFHIPGLIPKGGGGGQLIHLFFLLVNFVSFLPLKLRGSSSGVAAETTKIYISKSGEIKCTFFT